MTDSATLLKGYVTSGSEAAFGQLVARHVDLVYSAALRIVGGDAHLARDVAQMVFLDLARKAKALPADVVLSGWLYRHTFFKAAQTVRAERRRQAREKEAATMQQLNGHTETDWQQLAPALDEAVACLKAQDRDAILLRFFERQSLRAVGDALGISEEAARKRVDRAVAALRQYLLRRGVTASTATLLALISANAVFAAPTGLAVALAGGAAVGASATTAITLASFYRLLALTKSQTVVVGLMFVAGLTFPLVWTKAFKTPAGEKPATQLEALRFPGPSFTRAPGWGGAQPQGTEALARLEAWLRGVDKNRPTEPMAEEMQFLIWSLPAADYPLAWRLREQLQSSSVRDLFQYYLPQYWVELDPRAALAATRDLPGAWTRSGQATQVLEAWARKEPMEVLDWVRQNVPQGFRASLLTSVIPRAAKADPPAALAALTEIPSLMLRQRALSGAVEQWAAHDPVAAIHFVTNLPPSRHRLGLMKSVVQTWAQSDAGAARAWTHAQEGEDGRLLSGLIQGLADKNPAQAAALLGLEGGDPRDASAIARAWATRDLTAAAHWARQLPEGPLQDAAMKNLLLEWSKIDPRGAAEFALAFSNEAARCKRLSSVLGEWCLRDSKSAGDWAMNLPTGPVRDEALKVLGWKWMPSTNLPVAEEQP